MNLNELKKLSGINEAYGVNKARPFTDDPDYKQRFDKIKNMGNTEAMKLIWGWIHSGNMPFDEFYKLVADYWTHKPPVHKVDYKDDDMPF